MGQRWSDERVHFDDALMFGVAESPGFRQERSDAEAGRLGRIMAVELRLPEVFKNSTEAQESPTPCVAWKKPGVRAWDD